MIKLSKIENMLLNKSPKFFAIYLIIRYGQEKAELICNMNIKNARYKIRKYEQKIISTKVRNSSNKRI